MKMRPQLFLLAGGTALALGACCTWSLRHGGGVTFHETFVEILPGTNICPEDQKQLDSILAEYDSSLYKIKKTENGRVTTHGRLEDVLVEKSLLAQVGNAVGVSNSALQIGTQAHPDQTIHLHHSDHPEHNDHPSSAKKIGHNNNPSHNKNPSSTLHEKHPSLIGSKICAELVSRVTPVLKKYSHE